MKTFETQEIDLAAAIITATGVEPDMHPVGALVSFTFPDDSTTKRVVLDFVSGRLILDVKRFAYRRSWLYRQVSSIRKGETR